MEILSNKLQGQEQFNQESFSFSSFDFNSSLGIFTDDDEDDEHENDEAYIEITLEQEQEHEQTPPNSSTQGRGDDHGNDLELLRVSFSSVVPFPGFSCSSANDISACNFSSMNTGRFSSSLANTERQTETGEAKVLCIDGRSNNGGRMGYTALNQLVDVLLSALKLKGSSSSSAVLLGNQNGRQPEKRDSRELVRSRKAPTKEKGGARKLLIKFRSINILSMVASFVKPKTRQVIASSPINNTRTSQKEAITPPRTYPTQSNSRRNINKHLEGTKSYTNLGRRKGENSRLLEMNFDSITRMVEAVSKNIIGARGKSKLQSKSCPGSIKSSPIHQEGRSVSSENKIYARDNSVQAAIAHCKQSFGQYR